MSTLRYWKPAAIATMFILIFETQLLLSIRSYSQTIDESVHIFSGFQYWSHGDFGANPEHPPLVKFVAAFPMLFQELTAIPPTTGPTKASANAAATGLIYANDARQILFSTRAAISLFGVALLLLTILWANEISGRGAALIAGTLLAFEPNLITHAGLVTTDMGLTCLAVAAVYSLYRFVKMPTPGRLVVCGIALGFGIASKHTAILLPPIVCILVAGEWWTRRGEGKEAPASSLTTGWRLLASTVLIFVIAWGVLWTFYGFRYAARPQGFELQPSLEAYAMAVQSPVQTQALHVLQRFHLLPESYLWGLADVLIATEGRVTFILGRVYATGQWFFFPATFLMKAPVTLLLLLALSPFMLWKLKIGRDMRFLLVPPLIFVAAAMTSGLNLGLRHILPAFPFLILIAALSAWHLVSNLKMGRWVVGAALGWLVMSSLHAFPNYITYGNELIGGPANARRYMTDSNVDWDQGIAQLESYLTSRKITDCWFATRASDAALKYHNIPCRKLASGLAFRAGRATADFPPTVTGTVLISANEAAGQAWGPDELNPYKQFYDSSPDELIANTILVFNGTFDLSLAAAMNHTARARQLSVQKKNAEAEQEARAALELAPDSAEANATVCLTLASSGKGDESRPYCDTAITLAQQHHPEYVLLRMPSVRAVSEMKR